MIVIITGKSGVGKTTLRRELLSRNKSLCRSISYTTRSPRIGEINGVDYNFISKEEFLAKENIILKRQTEQNLYGVDKCSLQKKNIVMILDLNGIQEILKFLPREEIKIILLEAPLKILVTRLKERGTSLSDIARRLKLDNNLNTEEIKKRFPFVSLKVIDNSRPLTETIEESMKFINFHPLIRYRDLCLNRNAT